MIPIRNIYYMLSYAFQVLKEGSYKSLAAEDFQNMADLCAGILIKGISTQLKRGLNRDYLSRTEPLSTLTGKLDISESIKTQAILRHQMVCTHDEFTTDTELNRILKSTVLLLLKMDVDKSRKKELRKLMMFFSDVAEIDVHRINWNYRYDRNNNSYEMLMSVCYLVVKGLLQSQSDGTVRLREYLDEQRMSRLYEKFLLEYFRKEHPELKANASHIPWQLDDDMDELLPLMKSDITLTCGEKVLIIDAKYYSKMTQEQFGVKSLHSNNLYQIFTYVKNKEAELADQPHEVSGMLLYARTDENILPDHDYSMSGNKISVRSLDQDREFKDIATDLDGIAKGFVEK